MNVLFNCFKKRENEWELILRWNILIYWYRLESDLEEWMMIESISTQLKGITNRIDPGQWPYFYVSKSDLTGTGGWGAGRLKIGLKIYWIDIQLIRSYESNRSNEGSSKSDLNKFSSRWSRSIGQKVSDRNIFNNSSIWIENGLIKQ